LVAEACSEVAVVNVGTGEGTSVLQVAATVARHWPFPDAADALQFSGQSRPGDPFSLVANSTVLNELGFTWEIPVDAGLASYVQWFRSQSRQVQ
jgi:UDP-glucose 4-epimerase